MFEAEKSPIRAKCIRHCKNHNIFTLDWFMRCLDAEVILPWTKKDLWFAKPNDTESARDETSKTFLMNANGNILAI